MSLSKPHVLRLIIKHIQYKWQSYAGMFLSLLFVQLIGLLFAFQPVISVGTPVSGYFGLVKIYSIYGLISLTFLWMFINAWLLTTQGYREDDFVFVTNRTVSHISSMIFLILAAIIASVTAFLSQYIVWVLQMFFFSDQYVWINNLFAVDMRYILIGFLATILYIVLFAACGYFCGMLIQVHKLFFVVLGAALFYFFMNASEPYITQIFTFYTQENDFGWFALKVIIPSIILFGLSIVISQRMEVRK